MYADTAAITRVCTKCHLTKSVYDFYWDGTRGRWRTICKVCEAIGQQSKKSASTYVKRTKNRLGVLYFVFAADVNRIKIGISQKTKLERRLKIIQAQSPVEITLIGVIESSNVVELETNLHIVFKDYWIHSEWFEYTDAIAKFIKLNAEKRDVTVIVSNANIGMYNKSKGM
jgi:hypothetical protein